MRHLIGTFIAFILVVAVSIFATIGIATVLQYTTGGLEGCAFKNK